MKEREVENKGIDALDKCTKTNGVFNCHCSCKPSHRFIYASFKIKKSFVSTLLFT